MPSPIALHIEDDDTAAYLFRSALCDLGCAIAVFRVSDGEAALSFLKRTGEFQHLPRPHLVIVDLKLPKLNGSEVLSAMKAGEMLIKIPAVVLSTSDSESDKQRAKSAGSRRYVVKPFDYDVMVSEISAICTEFLPAAFSE